MAYQMTGVSDEYSLKLDLSREDEGFLEVVVVRAQEGRIDKRHASAPDHADNIAY